MAAINKLRSYLHSDSLRSKVIQGGGVLALGSFADNLLRFVRNMILARLLAPDAFGLMAAIIATIAAAEAFAEVGLSQSVIQNKRGSEKEFLNIIWWLAFFRAVTLYIIAFFAAPFICNFLNKPDAVNIMRIAFIAILFRGITSPNILLLQKEFMFTRWVLLTQGASCTGVILAIVAAFYFRNIWALVLGYISEAFLICALSYIFYPLMPSFKFHSEYARDIMRFSQKIFGLPILMVLYVQVDNFVIGKLLSLQILGLYYLARNLAEMPSMIFSKISSVFLPTFSLLQDDKAKMKKTLLDLTEVIATFGIPFFMFFIVFSRQILSLTYTPEYGTVAIPFGILSVYVFLYMLSSLIMNMVIAAGSPDKHRMASLARTIFFLLVLYPATKYFGLIGATLSGLFSMVLCISIQVCYLRDMIDLSILEYLAIFKKGMVFALITLIPGILFNTILSLQHVYAVGIGVLLCLISWGIGIMEMNASKKGSLLSF